MNDAKKHLSQSFQKVGKLKGHDGPIESIRFTDDAKYCLTAGQDRTVKLWNPLRIDSRNDALLMHIYHSGHMHAVTCVSSHDTTLLSASGKTLVITDMVDAKIKQRFTASHLGRINDVDLLNDVLLFSASYDGTVKIWDTRNRQKYTPLQTCDEASDSVTSVILDGEHSFYSSSVDGNIRMYDIRQGRVTCCDVGSPIVSLAVSDDCLAASCLDGTIRLVEKDLGELLNTYCGSHTTSQFAVGCAITSHFVVTGSEKAGIDAALYDLISAQVHEVLEDFEGSIGPTCSIDGKEDCIVTASYKGNASVWTNNKSAVVHD